MSSRTGRKPLARAFATVGALVVATIGVNLATTAPAGAVSTSVVISQVYGGGGNSGATYTNDFVELYNLGSTPVDVTGWSVQYAATTGSSWSKTSLSGTIQPGHYFLVQEAAGTGGTASLPAPDAVGTITMSATAGKVALVSNSTTLTGSCPSAFDFVGFGATTNCYEGTGPTPTLSNITAAFRAGRGTTDTDNNSTDFTVGAPDPRDSYWPITAVGTASPNVLLPGEPTLLTVAVTVPSDIESTGQTVICNLTPIGGTASTGLYDDGTNGDATTGDGTFSLATTVGSAVAGGSKNVSCTFADAQARSLPTTILLTVVAATSIGAVNGPVLDTDDGAAHVSAMNGQTVTVQGVIYEKTLQAIANSTNTYKGFFLQSTSATTDGNPNTSDGLFVFMNTNSTLPGPLGTAYTPTVGDEIVITGKVSEYFNMTELVSPFTVVKTVRSGVAIDNEVPPVVANPPTALADANRYWERLQGMRVQVPKDSVVLGGRNVFSPADAEIWVARSDSTIGQRTGYLQRAFRDAHPLDDNYDPVNWDGNGYRILMGSLGIKAGMGDAQALIEPARTFDTLTNEPAGGLNYTFSKYRIEVADQPTFAEGADPAANHPPQVFDDPNHYTVVDYNLENLYDYRDNPFSGCDFNGPGNAGCLKTGTPFLTDVTGTFDYVPASDTAYQARLTDIATQIVNDLHSPDVLMVQEVENQDICTVSGGALTCGTTDLADGKPDTLQELALTVASLGGPSYDAAFDRDSADLRGIAPAFLYRTDRVELLPATGDPVLGESPAIGDYTPVPYDDEVSNPKTLNAVLPAGIAACETSWVFPRAVDVALFRIFSTSGKTGSHRDVYVLDNHFKSGPDTCVAHRTEQAKYTAALVSYLQTAEPDARIVLGGDLNVYPPPDGVTRDAPSQLASLYDPALGLKNLWNVLVDQAPEAAYSYVYLGMAQTLDQMFVNQGMLADLTQFRVAHINSDFPADYAGDVARGTSDHDPNVATFLINDPPTVTAGPYEVTEGMSITLTATAVDPEGQDLTYAWDLDNNGSYETAGATPTYSAAGLTAPATRTVGVRVTDNLGVTATAQATVYIEFPFTWRPPLREGTNTANAGSTIPIKFSLSGYRGLDVIAAGYPKSGPDSNSLTTISVSDGLAYTAANDTYTLQWKTDKKWAGTTRLLVLRLSDNATYTVTVRFTK